MNELTKKFAKLIREHRLSKEYSQEYIASQLSISQQAYQKIESGKTKIDLVYSILLFKLLDIDFNQLTSSKIKKNIDEEKEETKNSINVIEHLTNEVIYLRKMNSELLFLLKNGVNSN